MGPLIQGKETLLNILESITANTMSKLNFYKVTMTSLIFMTLSKTLGKDRSGLS